MSGNSNKPRLRRSKGHRRALMRNLAKSLLKYEVIKTTLPKAKGMRGFVERLITLAKQDTTARRRLVFSRIQDKEITKLIFSDVAKRFLDRPGGYTRVLKCGYREGDAAPMAYIELVA